MEVEQLDINYLEPSALLGHLGIAKGMWVGDFGVGAGGHFLVATAKLTGTDGGVVMFDVSKPALSGAMTRAKLHGLGNYRAVWTNLEIYEGAPGVADNSLDAGLLVNVLHQSTKHRDILAEIGRMMKHGSRLLVVDWKQEAKSTIAPPTERRLSSEYLEDIAKEVDWTLGERFSAGPYHWGVVLVKA